MYGERIKELRVEKGLNQDDLAGIFNITRQAISSWETEVNEPDIAALIKLSEFFNVSIDYLLGTTQIRKNIKCDSKLELYIADCIKVYEKHVKIQEKTR